MNNDSAPVTRAELNAALTTAQEHIITAVARLIGASEARIEARIDEKVSDSETRLLTAFHKFAERQEARWTGYPHSRQRLAEPY
ncbi:MAG: hypothetical protein JNL98_39100 [Bryobacterales bacterium]|nr:hypothetical protein [Bryobacterales bacterium]